MCIAGMCCIVFWSAVSYCTFCTAFETSYGQRRRLVDEIKIHVMKLEFEVWVSKKFQLWFGFSGTVLIR